MLYPSSLFRLRYRLEVYELVAGALAPAVALLVRDPDFFGRLEGDGLQATLIYIVVAALTTMAAGAYFRIGQIVPRYLGRKDVRRILKASAAAAIVTAAIAFSLTRLDVIPRSMPLLHFIVLSAFLIGWRLMFGALDRRRARSGAARRSECAETIIVAGANDFAHLFLRMLGNLHSGGARVVAVLDDDPKLNGRSIGGYPVLGTLSQADALIHEFGTHGVFVERVVVAYPDEARRRRALRMLAVSCERHNVKIDDLSERLGFTAAPADNALSPAAMFDAAEPLRLGYFRARHALERVVAGLSLVMLLPLFLLTGLLVWIDVGRPLVFWQERVGRNGRTILIHKFRTLRVPVDTNGELVREEERLSAIGAFLRRTRLDELPQLFDVLSGHMSLIGPRPLLPADLPEGPSLRHRVSPGLTGWAQVHGGNLVTNEEKNALDEWYIHHASLRLDITILARTTRIVLFGEVRDDGAIAEAMRYRELMLAADNLAAERARQDAPGTSNVTVLSPRPPASDASAKSRRRGVFDA